MGERVWRLRLPKADSSSLIDSAPVERAPLFIQHANVNIPEHT